MNVWEAECEDEDDSAENPACPGVASVNPLELCVRWSGLSLRTPQYGHDDEEGYEQYM